MISEKVICPVCHIESDYSAAYCRCGQFLGFPNRRDAENQKTDLDDRYTAAMTRAASRGVDTLLRDVERLAYASTPVICMSIEAADNITRDGKYRNYHNLVDHEDRKIAKKNDHSDRIMVGEKLFPGFAEKIHYAALSPNGRGLSNYGEIAISWRVDAHYLEGRISVHEENSFNFFDRHSLGIRGTDVPSGYAGVWGDRHKVAAAKLEPRLITAMSFASLGGLLLHDSTTRSQDDFVEVAIYASEGIDSLDVESVTVQHAPTQRNKQERLELIKNLCVKRKISFST